MSEKQFYIYLPEVTLQSLYGLFIFVNYNTLKIFMDQHDEKSILPRLTVIDALRGFALFGLFSVHMQEHFNLFVFSPAKQAWLQYLDTVIPLIVYFCFGGKAYAIFAFLFGLSFFIQMDRQARKGIDFSPRFVWRLTVLFLIGFLHGLVYSGDILSFFAVTGLILVFLYKLRSKILWILAILLLLQIPIAIQVSYMFYDPSYRPDKWLKTMMELYEGTTPVYTKGSAIDVLTYNWYKGKLASWLYMFLYGRLYQTLGLFILGILLGRSGILERLADYKRQILWILGLALAFFLPLHLINVFKVSSIADPLLKEYLSILISSYANLCFAVALCASFVLLYYHTSLRKHLDKLSAVGRMSLSNYVWQSVLMVPILFGFGLGLYDNLGATHSFVLGLSVFAAQVICSNWWMRHFHYGPLEWLWRSATFLSRRVPFKRS